MSNKKSDLSKLIAQIHVGRPERQCIIQQCDNGVSFVSGGPYGRQAKGRCSLAAMEAQATAPIVISMKKRWKNADIGTVACAAAIIAAKKIRDLLSNSA